MKLFTRFVPLFLALCVLLGYLASCASNKAEEPAEPTGKESERSSSFTCTVNKFDNLNYSVALADHMIENPEHAGMMIPDDPVCRLNSNSIEQIRDMSGETLPDNIDQIEGDHNGENYIAYTFYLFNDGEKTLTYEYNLSIISTTNGVEKGVRVRLYEDGVPTTYARTKTDGSGPEEETIAFMGDSTIVRKQVSNFGPEAFTRFTIVIWIEGNDDDTANGITSGQFKVDMKINIIGDENGDSIDFDN